MAILIEPSWYREIVSKSEQRGFEQGFKEGFKEGFKKGFKKVIPICLEVKFPEAGLRLNEEIQKLEEVEILDRILAEIRNVNSVEELREIYQNDRAFS